MPSKAPYGKLNIAIAGLGRMGKRHAKTLLYRVPHANLVAVCSTDERELQWAREFFKNGDKKAEIQVFDSYSNMLELPGLQAVWVSTSTNVHAPQTTEAINKGLHVLCEKPLSQNLDEARAVVDLAKRNPQLKVMAGYSRRFDASYRDAKEKVERGVIGRPFVVRSQTCDLLDETGFFVRYAAKNGGMFVDCCIHDIDLSLFFLGNVVPKAVWAIGTISHHPELAALNDVDNGVGMVEYWDGKMAYFYCSRTQAHGHDVATEVTGTNGKVSVNVHPHSNNVLVAGKSGISNEVQPEYWERFEDAFATEANEFCESVLEDKPVPLPLELGLKSLEIGWALQDALLSGKTVHFDQEGKRLDDRERSKL
ncbi:NAD(P)-binding protein [Lepidopterella palustris CBS 459.81]|uniref:NAD(P)-binding protein n=1 Tax=Lepidopterella palustris CBS 459.81 TaxID=1314670 RepID=A0A8E2E2D9_9PEZI|nr:NAD(P)-binding protein [Lepidopterella palustris CBS 459.81]